MRALTIISTAAVVAAFAVSLFSSDATMAGCLGLLLGVILMGHAIDYRDSLKAKRKPPIREGGARPTEQTCLTVYEEVDTLRHAIEVVGFSDSMEAFDVTREEAERGAISTLNKVLNYFDEHDIGDEAR